ncbi:hypothetical protein ABW18_18865 [Gordonia jacobaea]|uniref:Uncharacterized protein n=1 Tax=Gordonia jacobaea TaxID=122202 RepID=A0ABR5I7Z3_9ACTN|nr:hypothetical protein ABW18_18865 [Gordonia jacobaea]
MSSRNTPSRWPFSSVAAISSRDWSRASLKTGASSPTAARIASFMPRLVLAVDMYASKTPASATSAGPDSSRRQPSAMIESE